MPKYFLSYIESRSYYYQFFHLTSPPWSSLPSPQEINSPWYEKFVFCMLCHSPTVSLYLLFTPYYILPLFAPYASCCACCTDKLNSSRICRLDQQSFSSLLFRSGFCSCWSCVLFSILFEKLFHLCYNNVPICFVNILTLSFSESRTELYSVCYGIQYCHQVLAYLWNSLQHSSATMAVPL